jgi:hypothetical protein
METVDITKTDFSRMSFEKLQTLIQKIREAAAPKLEIPEKWKQQVSAWKKSGKVKHVHIEGDGSVFFSLPTRTQVQAAEEVSVNEEGQVNIYAKADRLMADCYLGGDISLETISEDTELYMAVAKFCLYELVTAKNVTSGLC